MLGCLEPLGASEGHQGVHEVSGCNGAGSECRYSGARMGIGGIRGHLGAHLRYWAIRGCLGSRGYQGCIGGWQGV